MELIVYESPQDVSSGVADRIAGLIGGSRGPFSLGLAGGSTPEAMYRELRNCDAPWERVTSWLSDERWVPHDHERSNGRMASETLTSHVASDLIRPEFSPTMSPEESASAYERALRDDLGGRAPELILLGLGEDGHTASLFPGSPALSERERLYAANVIPATDEPRLTATYPLLWAARRLMVLVYGKGKAEAVRDSFQGKTPAGLIGQGDAEVEWHVDAAASALLS